MDFAESNRGRFLFEKLCPICQKRFCCQFLTWNCLNLVRTAEEQLRAKASQNITEIPANHLLGTVIYTSSFTHY